MGCGASQQAPKAAAPGANPAAPAAEPAPAPAAPSESKPAPVAEQKQAPDATPVGGRDQPAKPEPQKSSPEKEVNIPRYTPAPEAAKPSLDDKPKVVFVLGGPGAGKGTQCANIVKEFGWVHLSAGDLLRAEQATDSADSQLIKEYIKDGKIVPVEITIKLLLKAMETGESKKFLIDGFPRSRDNREGWEKQVGDKVEELFCLNFECTEAELEKRLLKRGETSGRADDNIESIKKRFRAFAEQTAPVLEFFKGKGMLRSISAIRPIEEVWADVKTLFQVYAETGMYGPKAVVIAGPSGVGKGTLIERLKKDFPTAFGFSVSHTTRGPRPGEEDGVHYHFSTREKMQGEIDSGKFIEYADVHGNFYGTSKAAVLKVSNAHKICILDIDVQGCRSVRAAKVPATFCFVAPPSMEQLEARLRGRGTETEDKIVKRLAGAQKEMDAKEEAGLFDHVMVNDDLEAAYNKLKEILAPGLDALGVAAQPAEKPKVVFVLGGPGAGKGTQCANIVKEFGWVHLSAGDLLRAEQATDSADSQLIKEYIKDGKIVPVEITIKLLLKAMETGESKKFLIDGFPRSRDNREGWEKQVGDKVEELFCLNFECTEAELEKRLLKRGETSGRADDNIESIKKRFRAFAEQTAPVLEFFKGKGMLRSISAIRPIEEVWADVKTLFQVYAETGMYGPKAVVIAGPSGVGKGTLIERLKKDFPTAFGFSVSHTTRGPRPGEEDGVHYHFSTREKMQGEIDSGKFIEYADVHGNFYGTSKAAVLKVSNAHKICILDIDVQGCRSVRAAKVPATFCFVAPPSMEQLEARLRGRGTETEDKIVKRLAGAQKEMDAKEEAGLFDHVMVNDDLEAAYNKLKEILAPGLDALGVAAQPAEKPKVVFVLGGPGAGKGTQCANIVKEFGWVHLSAGDLLRAEQATDSADSQLIKEYIKDGKIVPVEITIKLLLKAMETGESKKFLIDGFPRSRDNREGWEKQVGDKVEELFCLNFECTEAELEKRLLKRGETSGRADDNIESIKKRFRAFAEQTAPVLEFFKGKGMLRSISAIRPIEEVWADVKTLFQVYAETGMYGPKAVVIAGPSGVGKGTLIERLKKDFPTAFGFSVSHTTRGPRPGEEDGVHYHFSTREKMQGEIDSGKFIEYADVHGNFYGTSKAAVLKVSNAHKICILDIDVQGCRSVRAAKVPATFCFVAPPSMEQLEARLRGRGTETEDKIVKRLAGAQKEMDAKEEAGLFDHVMVNDDLEAAYNKLKEILAPGLDALGVAAQPAEKPKVVFVLGGPGAGKGTQCANIVKEFGWVHLSAGDLLRAEQATDSADSQLIKEYIKDGKIVPVEITIKLLLKAMETGESKKFLIDGFPRSRDNREGWEKQVGDKVEELFCLNFECTEAELEKRLLKRGETSGRADDNIESIKKRFRAFAEQTAPVLEFFKGKGMLRSISAIRPIEEVWADVKTLFQVYAETGMYGPKAVVIAGPSGVGKGTLIERLKKDFPTAFGFSVSHTTRGPRPGEEDGVHYHFSTREKMQGEIDSGKFIEYADVHGNFYGTSKAAVLKVSNAHKICILDIDVQGCRSVRAAKVPATFCFVAPPSMEQLEARLRGRGTETEDKIVKRLAGAQKEMDAKEEAGLFDHVMVNDDLEAAYNKLKEILAPGLNALGIAAVAAGELSWAVLEPQDDIASKTCVEFLDQSPAKDAFIKLSETETALTVDRDAKDADALKAGIAFAQSKGVLKEMEPAPYTMIDVMGKTASDVAEVMVKAMGEKAESGCVMVLVGLSGTGKGTTMDKLKAMLPKATTWSNGNIFRSLTLMACQHCEKEGIALEKLEEQLTAENLKAWMERLKFGKFNGSDKWDVEITPLEGEVVYVSEVQNSLLKEPRISKNIPTVAKCTQGEVVLFAADACTRMGEDGSVVLVEGREETINFMPTEFRFCLTMSDMQVIGKRRAVQRVVAEALKLKDSGKSPAEALAEAVTKLAEPEEAKPAKKEPTPAAGAGELSWAVLEPQDDIASKTCVEFLDQSPAKDAFIKLSETETALTVDRDAKDADALKAGIAFAQSKGVLKEMEPAPYTMIDVMGKTASDVAEVMVKAMGEKAESGCVMVLVGLSGTGKGTTMDKLKAMLPKATTWSNGNIFRSLTLMACQHCEKEGIALEKLEEQLTAENLKAWMERLKFGKFNGSDKWDVEITPLEGEVVYVSEVQNSLLKEPRISKNIPTVAKCTQGEVVLFAADACTRMGEDGSVVLVEGREETINFMPTEFRFCLTMSDMQVIGKRRAVQRVVAEALKLKDSGKSPAEALAEAVTKLAEPEEAKPAKKEPTPAAGAGELSWAVLEPQDDIASKTCVEFLDQSPAKDAFIKLSETETALTVDRDAKDADALKAGIAFAQSKGVLKEMEPAPYTMIDVMGKTASDVAEVMVKAMGEKAESGCVMVLVGLSGTGKGTTMDKLKAMLPKATTWSNGNIFRSLTLMACQHCEKEGIALEKLEEQLTAENLKAWMERLKFGKFNGSDKWDVEITPLEGEVVYVSEVQNSLLKEPRISKNIPTVAKCTQGEVVLFAADACTRMGEDGSVVLVEGREETINFMPTEFRFCLTMSDMQVIGKRRAVQRVVAEALKLKDSGKSPAEALAEAVTKLAEPEEAKPAKKEPTPAAGAGELSWAVLEPQDDIASKTCVEFLDQSPAKDAFIKLSETETALTVDRDAKDADALKAGIAFAQSKGVLKEMEPAPYTMIDVMGKTASDVAEVMVKAMGEKAESGCVMVLVGLSGTGKGTTMDKLKAMLPKATTWSNGNIFRSLTLMACQHCEKEGIALEKLEEQLTAENLKAWMERLKFGKFNGSDKWDVEITPLEGEVVYVSEVQNSLLKEPRISKNIPTVAKCTQGEVVLFAADACTRMGEDGSVVLVEGREETINFMPTEFRFCLTMSDMQVIGKRRAVQRVVAEALKLKDSGKSPAEALAEAVTKLAEPEEAKPAKKEPTPAAGAGELSWAVLEPQDDIASKTCVEFLDQSPAKDAFIKLSETETALTVDRDAKDADALKAGIAFAQSKGVLKEMEPAPYTMIDVMGKTASDVAEVMVKAMGEKAESGCVMVLVGLSGTGKGTTMDKLKAMLPKATTWSNGNIFRSLTLMACQHCEKEGIALEKLEEQLTAENLKAWMERLKFGKFNGSDKWDVEITPLEGAVVYVSEVQNSLLKEPRISKNIPTVAKCTQGEVVLFAADACTRMGEDGSVVLVEGREETINFMPTEFRFCLTMSDMQVIGKRRAVQRVVAEALKLKDSGKSPAEALAEAVTKLAEL